MEVLIVGLGSISAKHIIALKSIEENITIYALRSAGSANVEGIENIYNLNELNNSPTFVIISNPTQLHLQTITSLLYLNVPLFIEKPPSHSLEGVEYVADEINKKNIFTYVACNMRFHPCIQFLKSYLTNSRTINEVNVYCGSYLPDWRPGRNYREVYSANKEMGGGVHLDLFHEMDYTCWLFGFPESSFGFKSNKSSLRIDAADYANYILKYPSFNASIILNYYRKKPKRTMEILFDGETWSVDLITGTIHSDTQGLVFHSPGFEIINTYKDQMKYFINFLKANINTMNTFDESIRILKLSLGSV